MARQQCHYPHQEDARAGAVGHHCFLHLRLHCITIIPLASISRFLVLSKSLENLYAVVQSVATPGGPLISVLQVCIVSSVRRSLHCYGQ